MNSSLSEWLVYRHLRELLSGFIVAPILILSVFKIGEWDYFFSRLDDPFVQEYLILAALSFIFAYFLLNNLYRSWLLFYGFGISLIGVTHFLYYIKYWDENTKQGGTDYFYAAMLFSPIVCVVSATFLIWRQQDLNIQENTKSERLTAVIGLALSLILMIAEFLPWVREISKATSDSWNFKASGSNILIRDCCYITELGLNVSLQIYLPLIGISALFLIVSLGYRISNIAFLPLLVWCLQEIIDFLTTLGIQNPEDVWTKKEIEDNGLTSRNEGLFGGYLFVAGAIIIALLLLIPRVINGKNQSK